MSAALPVLQLMAQIFDVVCLKRRSQKGTLLLGARQEAEGGRQGKLDAPRSNAKCASASKMAEGGGARTTAAAPSPEVEQSRGRAHRLVSSRRPVAASAARAGVSASPLLNDCSVELESSRGGDRRPIGQDTARRTLGRWTLGFGSFISIADVH